MKKREFNADFAFGDALQIISNNQDINEKQMVVEIDMDLLDENPKNEKIFDMGEATVEEMMVTIREDGFKGAINVFKLDNGRYEIFAGHRRKRAMQALGETKMPCLVYENVDEITKTKLLIRSNTISRNHSPYSYAQMIDTYIKDVLVPSKYKGDKQVAAAEFMNMKRTQVSRYVSLLKLIPELQEFTKEKNFPFSALSDCTRKMPEEQQKELADYIRQYQEKNPDETIPSTVITMKANQIRGREERKQAQKNREAHIERSGVDIKKSSLNPSFVNTIHPINTLPTVNRVENITDITKTSETDSILIEVINELSSVAKKGVTLSDSALIEESVIKLKRLNELIKKDSL